MSKKIALEPSWLNLLQSEFDQDYMKRLRSFLKEQKDAGKIIYPAGGNYFAALNATPFDHVKVVILGQDPYHGEGQAHGLSFSVPPGVRRPPSLLNIFKELRDDLGIPLPPHGTLTSWAEQGVLLLNSVLTVEKGRAGSHQGRGWEKFTDRIIELLNESERPLVFILWGSYAQKKGQLISREHHLVIEGPHPSPLSAHRGFFGSRPFSQANKFLKKTGQEPIDWSLGEALHRTSRKSEQPGQQELSH